MTNGFNAVLPHQRSLFGFAEWAAILDGDDARYRQGIADRLDGADDVTVLGRGREGRQFEAADGQKNPARRRAERGGGLRHGRNLGPAVAGCRAPRRPAQGEQLHAALRACCGGVARDHRGERMRRIDNQPDAVLRKPARQPLRATKSADTGRHGRGLRVDVRPASESVTSRSSAPRAAPRARTPP